MDEWNGLPDRHSQILHATIAEQVRDRGLSWAADSWGIWSTSAVGVLDSDPQMLEGPTEPRLVDDYLQYALPRRADRDI